jgi:glycosyltransferase involved in cell wall biosynthesis
VAVLHGFSPPVLRDLRRYHSFLDMAVGVNRLLSRLLHHHVGLPPERSCYVPHAYAAPLGVSPRGARAGEIRLGYVGRLEQSEKRVLDLVGVVKALETHAVPYRLEIAGEGPCRDQLARELPQDRVRFLGLVPSEELHRSLYPHLDCLTLFSPAEGGPHVIWEAMYHGVVPVASRFRSCRAENALREGETGLLFDIGDIAGAAAHIERLHRDRALMEGLSARCRAAAQPRFRMDLWQEAWLAVLDATLGRQPASGGDLPPGTRTPSGLMDAWGVPSPASAWVRSVLGRTPESAEPGAEWPHCSGDDTAEAQQIAVLADRLDTVEPDAAVRD